MYTLQTIAEFGRGKDRGQRKKRRSFWGVVGHDAKIGAKIGAAVGAGRTIGGIARASLDRNSAFRKATLGQKILGGALALGFNTIDHTARGAILGAGVGTVRAPLRKK